MVCLERSVASSKLRRTLMDRHKTATHSPSVSLYRWFMTRRLVTCVALSIWVGLTFNGPILEAATLPTVDEVMQELHISNTDRDSIMQGKIVDWTASEGSDRELALGMAFLVKTKPEDLFEIYREALVLKEVSVITAHGQAHGGRHHGGSGRGEVGTKWRKGSHAICERATGRRTESGREGDSGVSRAESRRRCGRRACTKSRGPYPPGVARPLPGLSEQGAARNRALRARPRTAAAGRR